MKARVTVTLKSGVLDPQGKVLDQVKDDRQMDSGDLQRSRMSVKLPRVDARTKLTLKLTLLADGKMAYEEERDLEVWPNTPIAAGNAGAGGKTARQLSLYDPRGATAKALTQAGVAFDKINFLTLPAGQAGATALVIGEGAIDPATQQLVQGGIAEQTKQVLENLKAILEAAQAEVLSKFALLERMSRQPMPPEGQKRP